MTDPTIDKAALEAAIKAQHAVWLDRLRQRTINALQPTQQAESDRLMMEAAIIAYINAAKVTSVVRYSLFDDGLGIDPNGPYVLYDDVRTPTTDGVTVTVRELEWHPIMPGSTSSVADASFGEYTVEHYTEAATGDGWLAIYEDNRKLGYFGTEAAAKSACAEDYTARIMASLNISEAEPVAWVVLLNYGEGRWSGEMLTDVLPKDSTRYKIVRPLYASPTTSPQAPEGVRDDVLEVQRAWDDIVAERSRQVHSEGWDSDHDDAHDEGELLSAAVAYIWHGTDKGTPDGSKPGNWPWDAKWWKPRDRRSNLIRAGALCLAERDRLARIRRHQGPPDHKLGIVLRELAALKGNRT